MKPRWDLVSTVIIICLASPWGFAQNHAISPAPSSQFEVIAINGAGVTPGMIMAIEDGFHAARSRLGLWWINPEQLIWVIRPEQYGPPSRFCCGYLHPDYSYCGGYFEYRSPWWFYGGRPEIHLVGDWHNLNRLRALSDHEAQHALCWMAGGPNWWDIGHTRSSCW